MCTIFAIRACRAAGSTIAIMQQSYMLIGIFYSNRINRFEKFSVLLSLIFFFIIVSVLFKKILPFV
jgi:hypothetical protein